MFGNREQSATQLVPESTERLIAVWLRWEDAPTSHTVAVERLDAIAALGLDSCATHVHIAGCRRADMSIPDAVQSVVNDRSVA